jgi:hypothetical protein
MIYVLGMNYRQVQIYMGALGYNPTDWRYVTDENKIRGIERGKSELWRIPGWERHQYRNEIMTNARCANMLIVDKTDLIVTDGGRKVNLLDDEKFPFKDVQG